MSLFNHHSIPQYSPTGSWHYGLYGRLLLAKRIAGTKNVAEWDWYLSKRIFFRFDVTKLRKEYNIYISIMHTPFVRYIICKCKIILHPAYVHHGDTALLVFCIAWYMYIFEMVLYNIVYFCSHEIFWKHDFGPPQKWLLNRYSNVFEC